MLKYSADALAEILLRRLCKTLDTTVKQKEEMDASQPLDEIKA